MWVQQAADGRGLRRVWGGGVRYRLICRPCVWREAPGPPPGAARGVGAGGRQVTSGTVLACMDVKNKNGR